MKQLLAATAVIAALVTPVAWFFGRDPQPVIQVAAKPVVETSLGLISEEARQRIVTQAERRQEEQADAMLDDMHKIASGLRGLASDETGPQLVVGEVAATEGSMGGVAADLGLRARPAAGEKTPLPRLAITPTGADEREDAPLTPVRTSASLAAIPVPASAVLSYARLPGGLRLARSTYSLAGIMNGAIWLQREYPTAFAWYYLA